MERAAKDKIFHVHLVSDSTGETLESMANASLAQFEGVNIKRHFWPMIRSDHQMRRVMEDIAEHNGLVMYTVVNVKIREVLENSCQALGLPTLPILDPAISMLGSYFGVKASGKSGRQHALDKDYFARIDALHYTMAHDDGQLSDDLREADIIIVGVSRTSKTPTSIYLANKGFRTANVPFVPDCPMPSALTGDGKQFVVGLTTSPEVLSQIRVNRMRSINEDDNTLYTEQDRIKEEVAQCRRYCTNNQFPVIDVSRRSIEETAAAILHKYLGWRESQQSALGPQ